MTLTRTWAVTSALSVLISAPGFAQSPKPTAVPTPFSEHRETGRRVPFAASLTVTMQPVFAGWPDHDLRCGTAAMMQAVGTGASDGLGLLWSRSSHCVGELESTPEGVTTIPLAEGRFEVVDGRGRTVVGQYRGRLLATFNAFVGEMGPYGTWLFQGTACVSGGTRYGQIVDDCAAGRSAPVRGLVNLNTKDATMLFDQTLGVMGK